MGLSPETRALLKRVINLCVEAFVMFNDVFPKTFGQSSPEGLEAQLARLNEDDLIDSSDEGTAAYLRYALTVAKLMAKLAQIATTKAEIALESAKNLSKVSIVLVKTVEQALDELKE